MDTLRRHARSHLPEESCAILLGSTTDDTYAIHDAMLTENADHSSTSFAIPADSLVRAYEQARRGLGDVVGVFHSHPTSPAIPSSKDVIYMDANPVVWMIYSVSGGEMRAWLLDGEIYEIPLYAKQF